MHVLGDVAGRWTNAPVRRNEGALMGVTEKYDHWPYAWRAIAAEAVTRHGPDSNRMTTTATLASVPQSTVRYCIERDLERAKLKRLEYNDVQIHHLRALLRFLPAPVQCGAKGERNVWSTKSTHETHRRILENSKANREGTARRIAETSAGAAPFSFVHHQH
jgi:hypothetical protein